MKFKLNDSVIVIAGSNRGSTGSITKILNKEDRVVVSGVNKRIKHVKARDGQAGERIEFFAPIHASNIALIDPKTKKATRVRFKIDGTEKVLISTKSGEIITGKEKTDSSQPKTKKSIPKKKTE